MSRLLFIKKSLHGLTDWMGLGLALGIDYSLLEEIDKNKSGDTEKCKVTMLHAWLSTGRATGRLLVEALSMMGEDDLAAKIDSELFGEIF